MLKPATPADIVSFLLFRAITANNDAKKLINVPINSSLIASHLNKKVLSFH